MMMARKKHHKFAYLTMKNSTFEGFARAFFLCVNFRALSPPFDNVST